MDVRKVVHLDGPGHSAVTQTPDFSRISWAHQILINDFNYLKSCLKIKHLSERGEKQGKSGSAKKFPAELSTKRVDSFALALGAASLQRGVGIDDSEMKV